MTKWKRRVPGLKGVPALAFLCAWMFAFLGVNRCFASGVPAVDNARELILCIAPDLTSSEGTLTRFEKGADGQWKAVGSSWAVLFGRKGLAWGRGLNPPQPGVQKLSGDGKTPMGIFKIGEVLGYNDKLPSGSHGWPYHQVTDHDAWMDDTHITSFSYAGKDAAGNPVPYGNYNHLYTLPEGESKPDWWEHEKMHLGDAAYTWLVLIEHNYDDPDPAYGNEIFFHIRRGEHYRTAGCTTMKQTDLEKMIRWLKPDAHPILVQLTQAEYARLKGDWHLPEVAKD